ncbi:MAG: Uma2 family endonuclease [Nodosilinea sp.]
MTAQPQISGTYSPEKYLDLEVASDIRHEYIRGEIVPMTGGTPNHNRIISFVTTRRASRGYRDARQ